MEFNSLPLEVQLEVFSHLPVSDVMIIRRVCKLWNGLINSQFKFRQLQLNQTIITSKSKKGYVFNAVPRSFLDYLSTDLKFSKINYLNAFLVSKRAELEDAFGFFNSFKYLKKIIFKCLLSDHPRDNAAEEVQRQFVVSLDYLEEATFYLNYAVRGMNMTLRLDLPSLLCLSTDSLAAITVGHPEKLRTLATNSLFGGGLNYSLFTRLTSIFTKRGDMPSISTSFIEKLPSLSELHLDNYGRLPENYRWPEPSFGKANPKIFYFGFEVSAREIELEGEQWPISFDYLNSTENSTRFIARNLYRSIENNQHVQTIHYNLIAAELDNSEMFGVMPQKFPSIRHLYISGNVADEKRLLKFIDKFQFKVLYFRGTSLSQRFFEELAENGALISSLKITSEPMISDLNFILKLKNLSWLHFENSSVPLNFIRALQELKSINSLSIRQGENYRLTLLITNSSKDSVEVHLSGSSHLNYVIPIEEAPSWMNDLERQLNALGRSLSFKELEILLRRLQFEKEDALFWMRMYIYDQQHSICLSEKKMRLLNFYH